MTEQKREPSETFSAFQAVGEAFGMPVPERPVQLRGVLRVPVSPVPDRSDSLDVPRYPLFCHSREFSRRLEAEFARKPKPAQGAPRSSAPPHGVVVCIYRYGVQLWVPCILDNRLPEHGLWDVVGFFLDQAWPQEIAPDLSDLHGVAFAQASGHVQG